MSTEAASALFIIHTSEGLHYASSEYSPGLRDLEGPHLSPLRVPLDVPASYAIGGVCPVIITTLQEQSESGHHTCSLTSSLCSPAAASPSGHTYLPHRHETPKLMVPIAFPAWAFEALSKYSANMCRAARPRCAALRHRQQLLLAHWVLLPPQTVKRQLRA